ncbi:50S ribosomal protein L17 [Patescibacteria group bacterium]|nr:50S ribosomal protein L17 [Patescibacteria group bacterium]
MTVRKLGRKKENRERTLRNLATSLMLYEKVCTTEAKAKAVAPLVERVISHVLKGGLAARRTIKSELFDMNAVSKLFEDLPARQGKRSSGFVRITKLAARPGDGAPMAQLELLFTPLEEILGKQTQTKVTVRKSAKKEADEAEPEKEEETK